LLQQAGVSFAILGVEEKCTEILPDDWERVSGADADEREYRNAEQSRREINRHRVPALFQHAPE